MRYVQLSKHLIQDKDLNNYRKKMQREKMHLLYSMIRGHLVDTVGSSVKKKNLNLAQLLSIQQVIVLAIQIQ